MFWCEEGGQIEKSVGPFLTRIQRAQKVWTTPPAIYQREWTSQREPAVFKVAWSTWGCGYLTMHFLLMTSSTRLIKFPQGTHDDIVDCLSLIGRAIVSLEQGKPLPRAKTKRGVNDISLNELFELENKRKSSAVW